MLIHELTEAPRDLGAETNTPDQLQRSLDDTYYRQAKGRVEQGKTEEDIVGKIEGHTLKKYEFLENGRDTMYLILVDAEDRPVFQTKLAEVEDGLAVVSTTSLGKVRATSVYKWVLDNESEVLYSDEKQTAGGQKLWNNLAATYPNLKITDVGQRLRAELTEARLQPDQNYLARVGTMLDDANADYTQFLKDNDDKDDLEELVDILQSHSDAEEIDLNFLVGKTGAKAVDWYIQSAIVHGDGSIDVIIDPDTTIGYWGPKSFKDSLLKTLAHETIHLAQRDKMGAEKYSKLPSGYMQGVKKAKKTGKQRDMIRTYFRDPQELMAHGHDLAQEIIASSNPEDALRNPEKYRDELPAYDKHRQIFPPNAKPLQRLLSYAAGYVKQD